MVQEVVIPWRDSGCLWRRRHFEHVRGYLEAAGFVVVVGDAPGDFNRSAARNAGVAASSSPVAAVLDADNVIAPEQIREAVRRAGECERLVKPFTRFGYLTAESTERLYAGETAGFEFQSPPGEFFNGGAYVMRRELWLSLGGMDEGFSGWGAEDDAWHIVCRRRLGPVDWVPGDALHLWHPAHRVTSRENYDKLIREYVNGDVSSGN